VGEITIKNPAVMPGYWRNEAQTRLALRDGWLYTGDLGWLDQDGFLYFVDRKKDVIRRRGENISSQEVEDIIKRHSAVLDCAVIAVPSELGEDEVKAYVVARPGVTLAPEELVYWCADHLAYFKVPRYIELRDDFPRTPSLRVRKDLLRQEREDLTSGCFDREIAGIRLR
jgi:acyl-CoA synthetase (AMP-forming)/AMP-acid ligase II